MYLVYVLIAHEAHRDTMSVSSKACRLMYNAFFVFVRSLTRLLMRVQWSYF